MSQELTLSVLDQSPVRRGGTAAQALHETVALAQIAERLGYRRYWVAEHHSSANFAGTAPEILIGQIAANTSTIRVGSGGVMLSHYSALKVAETFRVLAAFFPGRIDVGIGRAPGSDGRTAIALADPKPVADINQFPRQVADLVGFLSDTLPEDHRFAGIEAHPGPPPADTPEVWLLGSSDYSAVLAAQFGLPFAFADFFGNAGEFGPHIAALYRSRFQPSAYLAEPKLNVAVHVICAETDQRARFVASSMKRLVAQLRTGGVREPLAPPEESPTNDLDNRSLRFLGSFTRHLIEGDPESVRTQLIATAERYETAELTIATNCYAFEDRVKSYTLVAEVMEIPPSSAPPV
jgi:luciferase family oxidoreductase group 1